MGRLGLDSGAEYVLNELERQFGSLIIWPETAGYRAEQHIPSASRTEHFTRDAIDLQFKEGDWARAEKVLNHCILNRARLGLEALIWNNTQWGYEAYGYSRWDLPQRQWWQPPAGWQKDGDFGISDPFHQRHIHLKVLDSFRPPKDDAPTEGRSAAKVVDDYFASNYHQYGPYEPVGQIILEEAEGNIDPALACALVEQESGGRNIFGCDWGSQWTSTPPYCNVAVTRDRVQALIKNFEAGGGQNGVGFTQLTSREYVYEAEAMGGAHIPRYQCRVGFRLLRDHILNYGYGEGIGAYNAGPGNRRSVLHTYAASVAAMHNAWKMRLAGLPTPKPPVITLPVPAPKPEVLGQVIIGSEEQPLRIKEGNAIAHNHRKLGRAARFLPFPEAKEAEVGGTAPITGEPARKIAAQIREEKGLPSESQSQPQESHSPSNKGLQEEGKGLKWEPALWGSVGIFAALFLINQGDLSPETSEQLWTLIREGLTGLIASGAIGIAVRQSVKPLAKEEG